MFENILRSVKIEVAKKVMLLTALVKNQTGRVLQRNVYVKDNTMIPKVHQGRSPEIMMDLLCSSGSQLLVVIFFRKNAPS